MNIAEQIQAKRAEIGQIERNITTCHRSINYFKTAQDSLIFVRYQSVHACEGGTVMLSPEVAEKAIAAQLDLLKIEIDKAGQQLQILINSQPK